MKDPDCGPCTTLTWPSGETRVIRHEFPKALEHHYALPALKDTSIPVYRGDFDYQGTRYRGLISIELEPRPNLVAQGVRELILPEGLQGFLGKREPAKWVAFDQLSVPAKKLPAPPETARPPKRPSSVGWASTTADHLKAIEVGDAAELDELRFFVFNGWFSLDGLQTCCDGNVSRGRVDTILGDWQLRIEPRGDVSPNQVRRHQRETGRSTVTHVGRIRRDDGARFDAAGALEVLELVQSLVGFALGRVTAIVLPVGYRDGKAVWARWECSRAVDPPIGVTPFLDEVHAAAQMTELLRAGYATSKNAARWEVFENALGYHYSAEHDATVNMKVLLPVSALQLISYAYLVEELPVGDPGHLTNSQWSNGLNTTEQLRNVLAAARVDMSVPKHFARLAKVQSDLTDLPAPDALDCVVRLRNKFAHPKQKQAKTWTTEEWAEAGFAATTMFNVAMLWWLNYDERFLGKTSEYRESVYVPWHKP